MSEGLTRRRGAHPTSSGSTTPPTGSSLPATPQLGSSSTMHGVGGTPRGSLSGGGGISGAGASSSSTTSAGGQVGSSSSGVEGRSKIAFDPRDYENGSMGGERERMPRLTVMEEVLLLGLKDKQVGPPSPPPLASLLCDVPRLTITRGTTRRARATCLSGTTTSRTPSVAVSSSNSHSDDE